MKRWLRIWAILILHKLSPIFCGVNNTEQIYLVFRTSTIFTCPIGLKLPQLITCVHITMDILNIDFVLHRYIYV